MKRKREDCDSGGEVCHKKRFVYEGPSMGFRKRRRSLGDSERDGENVMDEMEFGTTIRTRKRFRVDKEAILHNVAKQLYETKRRHEYVYLCIAYKEKVCLYTICTDKAEYKPVNKVLLYLREERERRVPGYVDTDDDDDDE